MGHGWSDGSWRVMVHGWSDGSWRLMVHGWRVMVHGE